MNTETKIYIMAGGIAVAFGVGHQIITLSQFSIGYLVGSVGFYFVFAFILAGILKLLLKIFKVPLTGARFSLSVLSAIVLIGIASMVGSAWNEKKGQTAFAKSQSSNEFVFQPDGSDFSVRFPSKPEITPVYGQGANKDKVTMTRAELKFPRDNFFLKAEIAAIPKGSANNLTDDDIKTRAMSYAEYNGLEYPEVSLLDSKAGRCAKLRAFKSISNTKVTYENHMCYGDKSMAILYVGAPSKDYPPSPAIQFFKSLEKTSK